MKTLRELYGVSILFFYFLKWPMLMGLPFMYMKLGYENNPILNVLWLYCLGLIIQDAYKLIRSRFKS